jgi:hypothetical protein
MLMFRILRGRLFRWVNERRFVMRIVTVKTFRDKYNPAKVYAPGVIVSDFDDARAKDLVLRGLAAPVKEADAKAGAPGGNAVAPPAGGSETGGGLGDIRDVGGLGDVKDGGDAPTGDDLQGIDLTQQHLRVIAAVKAFTDVEGLKGYLAEENASVKPRASVVDAMKERIAELSDVSF